MFSAVHRDFILALSANEVHVSFQNGTYHCTVYGTGSLLCVIPQVSRTSLEQYRTVIGIGSGMGTDIGLGTGIGIGCIFIVGTKLGYPSAYYRPAGRTDREEKVADCFPDS